MNSLRSEIMSRVKSCGVFAMALLVSAVGLRGAGSDARLEPGSTLIVFGTSEQLEGLAAVLDRGLLPGGNAVDESPDDTPDDTADEADDGPGDERPRPRRGVDVDRG